MCLLISFPNRPVPSTDWLDVPNEPRAAATRSHGTVGASAPFGGWPARLPPDGNAPQREGLRVWFGDRDGTHFENRRSAHFHAGVRDDERTGQQEGVPTSCDGQRRSRGYRVSLVADLQAQAASCRRSHRIVALQPHRHGASWREGALAGLPRGDAQRIFFRDHNDRSRLSPLVGSRDRRLSSRVKLQLERGVKPGLSRTSRARRSGWLSCELDT